MLPREIPPVQALEVWSSRLTGCSSPRGDRQCWAKREVDGFGAERGAVQPKGRGGAGGSAAALQQLLRRPPRFLVIHLGSTGASRIPGIATFLLSAYLCVLCRFLPFK